MPAFLCYGFASTTVRQRSKRLSKASAYSSEVRLGLPEKTGSALHAFSIAGGDGDEFHHLQGYLIIVSGRFFSLPRSPPRF